MFTERDKAEMQKWGALGVIGVLAMSLAIPSDLSRKVVATIGQTTNQVWNQ